MHLLDNEGEPVSVDALRQQVDYQHEPPAESVEVRLFFQVVCDLLVANFNPVGIEMGVADRQRQVPLADDPGQEVRDEDYQHVQHWDVLALEVALEGEPTEVQENAR